MIRLIASDIDDTLLDSHAALTPRTLAALKAAMAAGCRIALSSGRMPEAMHALAEEIGVNAPMVLFNGALIYDHRTEEILHAQLLSYELSMRLVRALEDMGMYVQLYPGRGYYCSEVTDATRAYAAQIHVAPNPVHMPMSRWLEAHPSGMQKLLVIDTPEGADRARAALEAAFPGGAVFLKSKPHYLEISPEGVDKGAGLRWLWEHLGLRREEVMAFGDGQNDAPMLAAAGTGCAVQNACPESLASADVIAPPNTEDGVAQVIEDWLSRGEIGGDI